MGDIISIPKLVDSREVIDTPIFQSQVCKISKPIVVNSKKVIVSPKLR